MGTYDLKSVLTFVTDTTGYEKVAYVGHSQGTTELYYALSEDNAWFSNKISLFVALGPVTKLPNTQAALMQLSAEFYGPLDDAINLFNMYEFLGDTWFTSTATNLFCGTVAWFCEAIERSIATSDPNADDNDRFEVYMGHFPSGSPMQSLMHYAQNYREDRFQLWAPDYNTFLAIGQHKHTDLIPLENIVSPPVAMFVGHSDILADPVDAKWASETINSLVHYQEIVGGHLSFMVGKDMTYFTQDVMNLIKKYQPLPNSAEPAAFTQ